MRLRATRSRGAYPLLRFLLCQPDHEVSPPQEQRGLRVTSTAGHGCLPEPFPALVHTEGSRGGSPCPSSQQSGAKRGEAKGSPTLLRLGAPVCMWVWHLGPGLRPWLGLRPP